MLDKWNELINKCKKIGRCNTIWLWHEETLAKMKLNLFELNKKEVIQSANLNNF